VKNPEITEKNTVTKKKSTARASRSTKTKSSSKTKSATKTESSTKRKTVKASKSKKSHLTKKDIEKFKQMLLAKRDELIGNIREMQEETAQMTGSGKKDDLLAGDLADMSTAASMVETGAEFLDRQSRLLEDIEEALKRIEDGTYGYCLATGKPISKARLEVIPWAKYCTEYAQSLEKSRSRVVR